MRTSLIPSRKKSLFCICVCEQEVLETTGPLRTKILSSFSARGSFVRSAEKVFAQKPLGTAEGSAPAAVRAGQQEGFLLTALSSCQKSDKKGAD